MIAQFYVKKFRQGKVLQSWGSLLKGSPHQSDGYELTDGHQTSQFSCRRTKRWR